MELNQLSLFDNVELKGKLVNKAYEFRIYPNKQQAELINKTFGCCRFVNNIIHGAHKRINEDMWAITEELYQNGTLSANRFKGDYFNKFKESPSLVKMKEVYPFLKEVDSHALKAEIANLDSGYKRYYKRLGGKPKFKGRTSKQSYTTDTQYADSKAVKNDIGQWRWETHVVSYERNAIKINKLGWVKARLHRKMECSRIYGMTIKQEPNGAYYCVLKTEEYVYEKPPTGRKVGIDLGISHLAILSDGTKYENERVLRQSEKKLARENRKLSKMEQGSNNWKKQKNKVARLHAKISKQRKHILNNITSDIVAKNDIIVLEDLSTANMMKNDKLSKAIADVSWHEFNRQIEYKADWANRTVTHVGKSFPSSQICNQCGKRDGKKDLSIRVWTCPSCGAVLDRDVNASINILNEGLRLLSE